MSRFILDVNAHARHHHRADRARIGVVMGLSHHVVVLDYGRKVGDGTPDEVRKNRTSSPPISARFIEDTR